MYQKNQTLVLCEAAAVWRSRIQNSSKQWPAGSWAVSNAPPPALSLTSPHTQQWQQLTAGAHSLQSQNTVQIALWDEVKRRNNRAETEDIFLLEVKMAVLNEALLWRFNQEDLLASALLTHTHYFSSAFYPISLHHILPLLVQSMHFHSLFRLLLNLLTSQCNFSLLWNLLTNQNLPVKYMQLNIVFQKPIWKSIVKMILLWKWSCIDFQWNHIVMIWTYCVN